MRVAIYNNKFCYDFALLCDQIEGQPSVAKDTLPSHLDKKNVLARAEVLLQTAVAPKWVYGHPFTDFMIYQFCLDLSGMTKTFLDSYSIYMKRSVDCNSESLSASGPVVSYNHIPCH